MNIVERLIQNTDILGPDGCWEWRLYKKPSGHGMISVGGRAGWMERVHRLSYRLFRGDIPAGEVVRHTCDNPACLNPRHLELGSRADNVRDMMERGGHISGFSKLSFDLVIEIRERFALGQAIPELAETYKVTERTVQDVVKRRTWQSAEGSRWRYPNSEGVPF